MLNRIILNEKIREVLKFLLVGLSGIFVNMFLLWFFKDILFFKLGISSIIAIELSVINNFYFNNKWTFKSKNKTLIKFYRYHISVLLGIIINYSILIILTKLGVYYLISNLIGIILATISNYILSSKWAWKK